MNRAAKVAAGVAVLVVGGLVALAAPAVSAGYAEVSSWAIFRPAVQPTEEPADDQSTDEDDPIGEEGQSRRVRRA